MMCKDDCLFYFGCALRVFLWCILPGMIGGLIVWGLVRLMG